MHSTHFIYAGEFYKQTDGAPMGSPLSSVIANLFMEQFEEQALGSATLKPSLWLRHVDDTFVIWPHGEDALNTFFNHLNMLHPTIKFTMEIEENSSISFLDVLISKRMDGRLSHTVYRKATHTDRYLNAFSHHAPSQKLGFLRTLTKRAQRICDNENIANELQHLESAFKLNGYNDATISSAMLTSRRK